MQQQQTIGVQDEYFTLNPWYGQQPDQPVFGLGKPLPRTVRAGTRWGKQNLGGSKHEEYEGYQGSEEKSDVNRDHTRQDRWTSQISLEDPLSQIETKTDDRRASLQRVRSGEADKVLDEREIDDRRSDRYDLQSSHSIASQKKSSKRDSLPPLEETHSSASSGKKKFEDSESDQNDDDSSRDDKSKQDYNLYRNYIGTLRAVCPQAPAEWLANTVMLFLGLAGNLSVTTSQQQQGSYEAQAWSWGIAVMVGIYIGGGVSGAHLNPWTSVSFSLFRGFPWRLCVIYIIAQFLAGLCAGALAWLIYREAILQIDPGLTPDVTGKAFYSLPQTWVSMRTAIFNDFFASALLMCVTFAVGDDQNVPPGLGMSALILGLTMYAITITMGFNTGLSIGPSRDFGPRLVAYCVGYGNETFTTGWWVIGPWASSLAGSIFGALVYDTLIFVGGESPVNFKWPQPGDIKWKAIRQKDVVKDKLHHIV
ncbi:aquaporin-like protein [Massariosphaeria phaeospora]|uniref:Aquaporin-like protein n=1 Tax=Massariosphaeria phaeospora TaxID=100035 RepID=A0A7C8M6I5_9PLEO|nr:aquaporin-like protein [Massariosphaeria phaeospora]